MSKIAEQKALEAYPEDYAWCKCDDDEEVNYTEIDDEGTKWLKVDCNEEFRTVYIRCYDQAMKDFLENTCEWLKENASKYIDIKDGALVFKKTLITDFKNYMQDE